MALVMLPCDLPWWSTVHKKLALVLDCTSLPEMTEHMQKIHDLCNVSLDPDDDDRTENVYAGLQTFVTTQMTAFEREHFTANTIKSMARRAQSLKMHRPPRGLEFSLQQQTDSVEISYSLMAALLANGFFSTFPKRTDKTHPTLQDFNFTHFFRNLHLPTQQAKLSSILAYFDWLDGGSPEDCNARTDGSLRLSRQVMTGKQWLTIEDWLECGMPLCPLDIRHDGRIERTRHEFVQTMFVSPRLGAGVLQAGHSQECLHLSVVPELLPVLLHMEALEDNETILVENARQMGRIVERLSPAQSMADKQQPKMPLQRQAKWEALPEPQLVSLLLMDAENYTDYPINQLEEDNILRELNKCLLAFRQKSACSIGEYRGKLNRIRDQNRFGMSPIVEGPGTPNGSGGVIGDVSATAIVIRQASTSTRRSSYDSEKIKNGIASRRAWLTPERSLGPGTVQPAATVQRTQNGGHHQQHCRDNLSITTTEPGAGIMCGRRGRFIVLGSSGECLPVNRSGAVAAAAPDAHPHLTHMQSGADSGGSMYSSCDSGSNDDRDEDNDDEEYLSARGSFDNGNGSGADAERPTTKNMCSDYVRKYAMELDQLENRCTFAEKLRVALSQSVSIGSDDNYTASTDDTDGGSTGFVLREDSLDVDDCFSELARAEEKRWLELNNATELLNGGAALKPSASSSSYSFSTDSELEEVYDQFSKWLDGDEMHADDNANKSGRQLDTRDEAIVSFAQSLLKRTLSESFVGMPLTDSACVSSTDSLAAEESNRREFETRRNRLILNSRSLSLELQKQKHRIAAQLTHKSSLVRHKFGNGNGGRHQLRNGGEAKRSLRWSIAPVNSQQTVNCEEVTLKLQLSQAKSHRHAKPNIRAVATGNWGCGHRLNGDVQLKLLVQWMAASVAGLPCLMYYTDGHKKLSKLDTVCRVLLDRKWTVGELAAATLQNAQHVLEAPGDAVRRSECLFEKLIGLY